MRGERDWVTNKIGICTNKAFIGTFGGSVHLLYK